MGILDFGDFGDFGFWGFWILDFGDLGFWILGILDFGFWGVWILDFGAGIPNPKSKIPNPNFFGQILGILEFWILDRYVAILYVRPQRPIFWILAGILNFGFWKMGIQDFGFWGFWILDFGLWGFWILDFGDFGDFGFWIFGTLCSRSLCAKFGFWILGILDFGFWGFWILDFGDFGFWILEFLEFGGLGILDLAVLTKILDATQEKKTVHAEPGRRIYL